MEHIIFSGSQQKCPDPAHGGSCSKIKHSTLNLRETLCRSLHGAHYEVNNGQAKIITMATGLEM
jgi:hypothetical protein